MIQIYKKRKKMSVHQKSVQNLMQTEMIYMDSHIHHLNLHHRHHHQLLISLFHLLYYCSHFPSFPKFSTSFNKPYMLLSTLTPPQKQNKEPNQTTLTNIKMYMKDTSQVQVNCILHFQDYKHIYIIKLVCALLGNLQLDIVGNSQFISL